MQQHFVSAENDVTLEVLDWGGTGRSLVLLAGLGNTAHVFGNLAPKLTAHFHATESSAAASVHPRDGTTVTPPIAIYT